MSATTAYQGRGSFLKKETSTSPVTFTTIAQLQKFNFGGLKSTIEDITNLSSPDAFKEILPTIVDPGDISFDGILDPANTTIAGLVDDLQNRTKDNWEIALTDGSTITFAGYVTEYVPVNVDYAKAITFSGKITISGAVVITPA